MAMRANGEWANERMTIIKEWQTENERKGWLSAVIDIWVVSHQDQVSWHPSTDSHSLGTSELETVRCAMNSSFVLLLLIAIATLQVNAFLPSSLKASSIFKQLSTRLQFKNFDEMLEQLEVPVLVDFYGDYSLWRSHSTVNVEVHPEMTS